MSNEPALCRRHTQSLNNAPCYSGVLLCRFFVVILSWASSYIRSISRAASFPCGRQDDDYEAAVTAAASVISACLRPLNDARPPFNSQRPDRKKCEKRRRNFAPAKRKVAEQVPREFGSRTPWANPLVRKVRSAAVSSEKTNLLPRS